LIKNPTYHGQRPNSGALATEALVSVTTWQQAQASLATRARPGRGPDSDPAKAHPKALLAPLCGADGCDASGEHPSPMYRVTVGAKADRRFYYRCSGRGPQRKGCGAPMVPCDDLDAMVTEAMMEDHQWHLVRTFVAGDDRSDDIARLDESGADAMRRGDYDTAMAKMAEAKQLRELPAVAAHWETRHNGQTVAEHFASLDAAGRRAEIAEYELTAWREDGETRFMLVHRSFLP
jgi:hypothetical protein